jgi:hypothetical protein
MVLPVARPDNLRVVDDALRRGGDVALVTLRAPDSGAERPLGEEPPLTTDGLWPWAVSASTAERPAPSSPHWPAGCRRIVLSADTGHRLRLVSLSDPDGGRAGRLGGVGPSVGRFESLELPVGDPEEQLQRVERHLVTLQGDEGGGDPLAPYRLRAEEDPLMTLYAVAADVLPLHDVGARQRALASRTVGELGDLVVQRLEDLRFGPRAAEVWG